MYCKYYKILSKEDLTITSRNVPLSIRAQHNTNSIKHVKRDTSEGYRFYRSSLRDTNYNLKNVPIARNDPCGSKGSIRLRLMPCEPIGPNDVLLAHEETRTCRFPELFLHWSPNATAKDS